MTRETNAFYSIIDYTASDAADQPRIAAAFARIQRDWVAFHPGYAGAHFLASTDGSIVRAIVEWESEAAFQAFERDSDGEGRMAALQAVFRELATQGTRQTFRPLDEVRPASR